ncbi:DUF3224 domain-containing protein [Actinoplanes sp. KI2]|uniref:DUF3224 domain-containing protein n=1 Tax=Actinoplanes sp. KI2 TaxID=2983315 RepID=UPI0021D5F84B|nr:DUF3224 domain-containing protein [Actinoplanes sp. KI2]MCU7722970.1 DUF3224 domain-containing protein [Actinoplanes sp. KI2]
MRATGTFEVANFTPAAVPSGDVKTAVPVGVATMTKTFAGDISGRSSTLFTAAYDQTTGVGTYVAMESFEGSIDGLEGAFNFAHSATTLGDNREAEFFVIVPGSGTGDLTGITGTGGLSIEADGTHTLWLNYEKTS